MRNYFDRKLKERKNWADSTILSLLGRLQEKGFLSSSKQGNRNLYVPLVSEEEYLAYEDRNFLQKASRKFHSKSGGLHGRKPGLDSIRFR